MVLLTGAVLYALGGWPGVAVAVVLGLAGLFDVWPRSLVRLGAVVLGIVPLVLLLRGLPARATLSPAFVTTNTAASAIAFVGFALVVVGLLWQRPHPARAAAVAERAATSARHDAPSGPSAHRPPRVVAIAAVVAIDAALLALAGWSLWR